MSISCAVTQVTNRVGIADNKSSGAKFLYGLCYLLVLTGCGLTSQQRIVYDSSGIQVGIMTDLSTDEHASPPVKNRHPADVTPQEIRSLVGSLEVSGWSGTTIGLLATPRPNPVFTQAELVLLAEPLATAFHTARPRERVFFTIQNPAAPYDTDRTAGSLFFRDDYLHVVLTDHYAFLQADPGGGEKRDPRDTKGMKLWVVGPVMAATVPEEKMPHWTAFEQVHISLKPADVLAGQKAPQTTQDSSRLQGAPPAVGQPALKSDTSTLSATESGSDLRLQIRELTNANLDLRTQQKEQLGTIEKLKAEIEQLRNEMQTGNSKPASKQKPSRQQTTP